MYANTAAETDAKNRIGQQKKKQICNAIPILISYLYEFVLVHVHHIWIHTFRHKFVFCSRCLWQVNGPAICLDNINSSNKFSHFLRSHCTYNKKTLPYDGYSGYISYTCLCCSRFLFSFVRLLDIQTSQPNNIDCRVWCCFWTGECCTRTLLVMCEWNVPKWNLQIQKNG